MKKVTAVLLLTWVAGVALQALADGYAIPRIVQKDGRFAFRWHY